MNADFAAALLRPELPAPPGLRAWNGSDPGRRFAVHRNNVLAALVDALAASFPVTQALVGEPFFRAMAAVFVRAQPPRSPVLHIYGEQLPDFIAGFAPAAGLPYLADVARLEFARVQACHAADAPVLSQHDAARVLAFADPGALRPRLHPALRWLASPHPVASLWAAHQGQGALEEVDPARAECMLVTRPRFEVLVIPCDAGTLALLACAQQGASLSACAAAGASCAGFALVPTLTLLMAHGALSALDPP